MKLKSLLYIMAASAIGLGAASCGDDNDDININQVPQKVQQAVSSMFPGQNVLSWEQVPPYYIAEFMQSGFETEAWFGADGTWAMTETDYDSNTAYLPIEVQEAFAQSEYSQWIVDDVQTYKRTFDSFCVIEVESATSPDVSLFYSADGVLLNQVQEFDITITPNTIISAL